MITLTDIFFWLDGVYFLVAILLAFYLPGVYFISKLKLAKLQEIVLSFIMGMVLWGWQGFVFGYLNIRWLSYIYLLLFLFLWLKKVVPSYKQYKRFEPFKILKNTDWILTLIIVLGVFIQLTSVWLTGVLTTKGLYFCCGNIADNILMISYTNEIVNNFPPLEPGMFATPIQNYHYWGSIIAGELVRVFHLPVIATSYQYMTVFISLFLGLSAVIFGQIVGFKKAFARWLALFLYFGGDLIWVLIALYRGQDFFAMNPLESGQQFLENIPRALAIVVFFTFMSLFYLWIKRKNKFLGLLMAVVAATIVGFKVYVGIFVLSGLAVLAVVFLLKRKFDLLVPILVTFLLSAFIYFPVNSQAGGLYYTGFWRFENFILQGYLGDLNRLEDARLIYVQHHNWPRMIQYELILASVFIFAIFGTKLVGLLQNRKSLSLIPREINILLIAGILVSLVPGLFFSQSTGGSNTFNFLVSIFIVGSIYSAFACYYWLRDRSLTVKVLIILLVVSLTIPRSIYQAYKNISNISSGAGFYISKDELKGLDFLLKQKDDSLVLVDPKILMDIQSPYISFLSDKKMFLSGQHDELEAHGIDFSTRLKVRDTVFNGNDASSASAQLLKYGIGYLYTNPATNLYSTDSAKYLKTVFLNKDIKIMTVDKNKAQEYLNKYGKN